MSRLVIAGFDGATWTLLDKLMEAGHMQSLQEICQRGVHGSMVSAHPPVTAPAWVSMTTGVNPGRHGCFDFNRCEGGLSALRPLQSWDIGEKTFYEVLEERGRKTILVNLPVTYPPLTKNVTLTSLLTQGDNAVFPESLKEKHAALSSYRCFPDTRLKGAGEIDAYLKDIRAVEVARFDCVRALWEEPWDCFFAVFSGTDWVSHEAFPDLVEGRFDAAPEALGMFRDADRYLGWMAERLGSDDHLLLVSDHGFTTAKGIFYLNEWLEDQGYLTPDYARPVFPPSHRMQDMAQGAGQDTSRLPPAILSAVHRRGGARFLAKVYRKLGGTWPLSLAVDPRRSRASSLTAECHGVTLHERGAFPEGTLDGPQTAALAAEIQEALAALTDPDGQHVFSSARRREEVYHGPRTSEAAHILMGPDAWGVAAAIKALKNIPFVPHRTGIHSSEGIFLGVGPAFARRRLPARAVNLLDVAPLVFHLLGEPIPEGLDGRLLPELFVPGRLAADPPRYAPVDLPGRTREALDAEAIQEKLRGLGYMG